MHAASRSALAQCIDHLDSLLNQFESVADAAQLGTQLFDCVEVLDSDRSLRVAVAEASTEGEQRAQLVRDVFTGKVGENTLDVLVAVAEGIWSTPSELRAGLVELGRRSLLKAAQLDGKLEQVEDELFGLSRMLEREPALTQLLSDRTATAQGKRSLLASVLYGKVTPFTEALALQAVTRRERGPIDDIAALSELAAGTRGKRVARVATATALTAEQTRKLETKLARIYGGEMVIHSEVDESLLGGMIIRVGDEIIDGSTAGKINRLKAAMA